MDLTETLHLYNGPRKGGSTHYNKVKTEKDMKKLYILNKNLHICTCLFETVSILVSVGFTESKLPTGLTNFAFKITTLWSLQIVGCGLTQEISRNFKGIQDSATPKRLN